MPVPVFPLSGHPVEILNTGSAHDDPAAPEPGMALCLSAG